ncbi:MAG: hypothetical protein QNI99_12980 [Woeseiaceae bacterium]|nr:hypothetical protein [Woeseiaceae bacterium]
MFKWFREWRKRRADALMPERQVVVTDEDGSITATYPDGTVSTVEWSDLVRIEVRTNDLGPWEIDVWWVLKGERSECIYPNGATGEQEMIKKFEKLDGFDDEELIRAMGCTRNNSFLCWQRSGYRLTPPETKT